jgi:hypothetical protein
MVTRGKKTGGCCTALNVHPATIGRLRTLAKMALMLCFGFSFLRSVTPYKRFRSIAPI